MILIYITCKNNEEAKKISKHLLEKKLIACTNIFPIESMYWWEGKIQEDNEFVVIAKTKDENYEKVKQEVKKIHSYKTPCILKIKAEANEEYDKWVDDSIVMRQKKEKLRDTFKEIDEEIKKKKITFTKGEAVKDDIYS